MLNKVDKLVEATMLALQGKLELKENKIIKAETKSAKLNRKKTEGIDVNVDEKTMVSVEGNETIVDTEDATVIVSKKEDTFVPETSDDVAMDNPNINAETEPNTDMIEVPTDDTVMPEEVLDEPVDSELPTEDEELPLGESKKVESIEIEIKDDGKEVEVKTDNGEEVEVKDETEDKEDKEDKDTIEVPEEDKPEDETVVEENKKLQEQVPDIVYEIAEKVANEIREKGVMNFLDIDNMIAELSGMTIDEVYEQQLQNDVYGCLGYEGIICNYSSGDFYTDEYAEKHPEVKEEGKHLTEGRVPENCYDTMIKYFTDVVKENAQNLDSVNNTTKYMDVIKDEKVLNDVVEYVLDDDELWNVIGETIQYYLDAYADGKLPFKYEGKQADRNKKDIKRDKKINRVQEMIALRRAKIQEGNNEVPYDNTTEKTCPLCKKKYTQYPALSRRDNKTYICPDCGVAEAMEDYMNSRKKKESLSKLKSLTKSTKLESKKLNEKYSSSTIYTYDVDGTKFEFLCRTYETSRSWGHEVELMAGRNTIGNAKVTYYNRTWETFRYQSCMLKAIDDAEKGNYDKDKLDKLRDQVDKGKGLEESKKVEDTEEYLEPRYDSRASFYKKAKVVTKDNGDEELYSYGTHVGGMRDGKPYSKGRYSQTTTRHQKEFFKQRGHDIKNVPVEEVKKTESKEEVKKDTNDLGIKEGVPKKEEPVPNTATKVQEGYIVKSFEKALYSYAKNQNSKLESVSVRRIAPTYKGIKIEARLNTKDGSKPVCLRLNKIQSNKPFDKYELAYSNGMLTESKANKAVLTTYTNKDKYIECRYILGK